MGNRTYVLAVVVLLSVACTHATTSTVSAQAPPAATPPTDLEVAKAAWLAAGITDYTMTVKVTDCFACGDPFEFSVTVVDGQVTEHSSSPVFKHDVSMTVEGLFKQLGFWGPGAVEATYNYVGVPLQARVDAKGVMDEEATYHVTFERT